MCPHLPSSPLPSSTTSSTATATATAIAIAIAIAFSFLSLLSSPPPLSSSSNMLNYLWIPLLFALSLELISAAKAQLTSNPNSTLYLLLPSEAYSANKVLDSSQFGQLSPGCPAPDPNLNYRPVIGIVSHPGDGASGRLSNGTNASYIAASYVKFVEAAGARVIPLIFNEPSEKLYQKVLERNDAGEHYPLLSICLGFELLTMIISKDKNILEHFSAADQASTLQFVRNIDVEGTVFQRFPPYLLKKLTTDCLVMQNHHWGISPEKFQQNADLFGFFKILTTSTDENAKTYVSTVQAHSYPVTAFQWHPEKNAFEWGLSMIPHTEEAVQVTQYVANYFVGEARKSVNRPPAQKVLDNLIYNYSPTYCGKAG